VNLLDALIVAAGIAAVVAGYRLGFVARVLSWTGLALGVFLAVVYIDDLVDALSQTDARTRLVAALLFVVGLAFIGQAAGFAAGGLVRSRVRVRGLALRADRVAGAALGVVGVLVMVWLATPALTSAPGWPAEAAQGSVIVRRVAALAPDPPAGLEALARRVGRTGPEVLGRFVDPPETGPPPTTSLAPDVDARVRKSTVKVEGIACDVIQNGSGFVVAPDLVVTNAHVVAGEQETRVITADGEERRARVGAFDAARDLALLTVDDLGLAVLPVGDGDVGSVGAVYGYPGGGRLVSTPSRIEDQITALGRDIYGDQRTERDVFVLAADLHAGDSGGALVNEIGEAVGVAFAIDPGQPGTAYALTDAELRATVDAGTRSQVDTGPCLGI